MRIVRSIDEAPCPPREGRHLSIGIFDGVHLGHRAIIGTLLRGAAREGAEAAVLTFDPHPRSYLGARAVRILTPLAEKCAILGSLGVDLMIIQPFDAAFAARKGEEFVEDVIVKRLGIERLVVGYDFRLGKGREGGRRLLTDLGGRHRFETEFIEPYEWNGRAVKSTWVRDEIERGNVATAAELLDRCYSLPGTVRPGAGRGRSLGAATANVEVDGSGRLWPAFGVYAVFVERKEGVFPGVANVGVRPTFENDASPSIEAHLFDVDESLEGETVRVHFVERIRDEKRFESAARLARRIKLDVARGMEILSGKERKNLFTSG